MLGTFSLGRSRPGRSWGGWNGGFLLVQVQVFVIFRLIVNSELNECIQAYNEEQHYHTNNSLKSKDMVILSIILFSTFATCKKNTDWLAPGHRYFDTHDISSYVKQNLDLMVFSTLGRKLLSSYLLEEIDENNVVVDHRSLWCETHPTKLKMFDDQKCGLP